MPVVGTPSTRTSPSCGWKPEDRAQQRRLARAVGADDRQPAAGLDGQPHRLQHPRAAVARRQPDDLDARSAVHRRRAPTQSRPAKNGAPTNAVTTPIGSSAGASTTRATRSASTRKRAADQQRDRQHPGVRAADEPAGDVRHDQADEADQPADRDGRGGGHRRGEDDQQPQPARVHAQRAGLVVADGEHVERPAAEQQHDARRDEVGEHQHDVGPLRAAELAEQPAVHLAQVVGVLLLDQGLRGGEEGGDGDPGEQQGRAVRAAGRRPERSAQPTPTSAPTKAASGTTPNGPSGLRRRVGDDQRRAQPGAGGGAEQVRVGERVAEDALVGRRRRSPVRRRPGRRGRTRGSRSCRSTASCVPLSPPDRSSPGQPVEQGDDDGRRAAAGGRPPRRRPAAPRPARAPAPASTRPGRRRLRGATGPVWGRVPPAVAVMRAALSPSGRRRPTRRSRRPAVPSGRRCRRWRRAPCRS